MTAPRELPLWWLCPDEAACAGLLDDLSLQARGAHQRLSVIDSAGTGISNLTIAENILLPADWHARTGTLRPEVLRWLSAAYPAGSLDEYLRSRPFGLASRERQRQAVARAIQLQASSVLFEDDSHAHERWLDEWLLAVERELPDARIQAVSSRRPSAPERWQQCQVAP